MRNLRNLLGNVIVFYLLMLSGCNNQEHQKPPIKIAISSWVGYTPILYAYEKGMLDEINIQIASTTSLNASLEFVQRGFIDAFAATQREYLIANKKCDFSAVILLDRSYGADKILSNVSKEKLLSLHDQSIDVYLEYNSINYILFDYYRHSRNWKNIKFNLKHTTQQVISNLKPSSPSLIVTYEPYGSLMKNRGFYEIESSKNLDLLIIDALFVNNKLFAENKERFKKLKSAIDYAIKALQKDPKEYYDTIKSYLDAQSYGDFLHSLEEIKWINGNKEYLIEELELKNIRTDNIL